MGILSSTTKARVEAAKKSVGSALAMFQKATDQIEAANAIILAAIAEDNEAVEDLNASIKNAQVELDGNNVVLAKLREFYPSRV